MATATVNPFEVAGRLKKAFDIARSLHRFQITAQEARLATPEEWQRAAIAAGFSHVSEATIALVIEKLEGLENYRD